MTDLPRTPPTIVVNNMETAKFFADQINAESSANPALAQAYSRLKGEADSGYQNLKNKLKLPTDS